MVNPFTNADGSCRSDPMAPGQLRSYHARAEAGTLRNHDFSSLRVRGAGGCAGREGDDCWPGFSMLCRFS